MTGLGFCTWVAVWGLSELDFVPTIIGMAPLRGHPAHTHCHAPQALVLLQLHADLDVLLVASWQELSQYVCAFTKALSQRPSKYAPPQGPSGGGTGLEGCTDEGS